MASSEERAPSPFGALSRLRRNKGLGDDSTTSLTEVATNEDVSPSLPKSGRLRSSIDGAIDKVKERRRRSADVRRGSDDVPSKRLPNLIPRKKKRASKRDVDAGRNARVDSGHVLSIPRNQSDVSLSDGRSSLLTDDNSDIEGRPVRPTLSPHESHAGYLTLSSPEINAHTVAPDSAFAADLDGNSTDSIPQIVEPNETETSAELETAAPSAEPQPLNRDSSPAGRLKKAFQISRQELGTGDSDSVKSVSSGGLGGLFRARSRNNSISNQPPTSADLLEGKPASGPDGSPATTETGQVRPVTAGGEPPEFPQEHDRSRIVTSDLPAPPPNQADTPTTYVTPPTPTDPNANVATFARKPIASGPGNPPAAPSRARNSLESIKHRRAQSANLPSKLSNATSAPLTPTVEETKTPGGGLTQPAVAAGFFSSFFSAAQKAADQLSTNINQASAASAQRKSTAQNGGEQTTEDALPESEISSAREGANGEKRRSAVETLGKGDLTFGHLGISDSRERIQMPALVDAAGQQDAGPQPTEEQRKKAEEDAAQRAVSVAYEKPTASGVSQANRVRPLSIASQDRLTLSGDQTPPRSAADVDGIRRTGSVRSKISGRKKRRHRASSATTGTGTTIATGLQTSATGLANGGAHRLTGFAVASSKRNKDFHNLFRSVPEDDYLIEDYSAALQRDILLHGRFYVSEGHICFSSNILGWVTNLVVGFDEVVSIEKKSTAVIFPNAIVVQTLHARNTFASFVARDSTYELLIGIWKISHPNLKSSLNGVTLDDAGTGDKTEVADPDGSDDGSGDESEDEVYDEDADEDAGSFMDAGMAPSAATSDVGDAAPSRKIAAAPVATAPPQANGVPAQGAQAAEVAVKEAAGGADFPGPASHLPTECGDASEHYDKPLTDSTVPAPLGKIYSMMFGPASSTFMRKWLIEDQKSRELSWPDDKAGLDNEHKTLTFDYIKPLSGSVGPKQTKCITTCNLVQFDLEKAVTIDCSTQTPDVPSGNVFVTRARYCLMWGPGNSTRVIANCTVEWSGKSWLKGPIEKGASDGQIEYVNRLLAALRAAVSSKPTPRGAAKKGKRRGKKDESFDEALSADKIPGEDEQAEPSWGLLEPLHKPLQPVLAIIRPFVTSQVIIAVLFVLLLYTWILPPYRGVAGVGFPRPTSPERLAAYEEIWRREESELWDWLEDRVGIDHLYGPAVEDEKQRDQQRKLVARKMGRRLENERMSERQVDDAIRVTEERLEALKLAVERKKRVRDG